MICPKCNADLPSSGAACSSCGYRLSLPLPDDAITFSLTELPTGANAEFWSLAASESKLVLFQAAAYSSAAPALFGVANTVGRAIASKRRKAQNEFLGQPIKNVVPLGTRFYVFDRTRGPVVFETQSKAGALMLKLFHEKGVDRIILSPEVQKELQAGCPEIAFAETSTSGWFRPALGIPSQLVLWLGGLLLLGSTISGGSVWQSTALTGTCMLLAGTAGTIWGTYRRGANPDVFSTVGRLSVFSGVAGVLAGGLAIPIYFFGMSVVEGRLVTGIGLGANVTLAVFVLGWGIYLIRRAKRELKEGYKQQQDRPAFVTAGVNL
jgi:hypothetical protein